MSLYLSIFYGCSWEAEVFMYLNDDGCDFSSLYLSPVTGFMHLHLCIYRPVCSKYIYTYIYIYIYIYSLITSTSISSISWKCQDNFLNFNYLCALPPCVLEVMYWRSCTRMRMFNRLLIRLTFIDLFFFLCFFLLAWFLPHFFLEYPSPSSRSPAWQSMP